MNSARLQVTTYKNQFLFLIVFLHTNNEHMDNAIKNRILFTIAQETLKYLDVANKTCTGL